MSYYLEIFHLGQNIYEGNQSNPLLPLLGVIIGAALSYGFSVLINKKLEKKAKTKEELRIAEIRIFLLHLLLAWKRAIVNEIDLINTNLKLYGPKWVDSINTFQLEALDNLNYYIPPTDVGLMPIQILKLDINDIFKILLGNKEPKQKRQTILTTLYTRLHHAQILYDTMNKMSKEFREKVSLTKGLMEDNCMILSDTINRLIALNANKSTLSYQKLLEIKISFQSQVHTVENFWKYYVKPIHDFSTLSEENFKSEEMATLHPIIKDYVLLYKRGRSTMEDYRNNLEFWSSTFAITIILIDKVIEVEYPKEKINDILNITDL